MRPRRAHTRQVAEGRIKTRVKELRRSMSLTGAIVALAVGVIVPVLSSTSVGIVLLALGESSEDTVFGVLVLSFAAAAFGSAIVVTVLLGRRARVARLQADFTANITHELRTPLTAIRMYAQTLQMGRLDGDSERIEESLKTIMRETEWLEAMIDRVLTWREAEKDWDAPALELGTLCGAVDATVVRFRRMFDPDEVDLKVDVGETGEILLDEELVSSLLLNLLINAYKYTGEEKRITVTVRQVEGVVEMSVEDNGIGIPKDKVGKIFDPFYRADHSLHGKSVGAGLGLAIVRHHTRALGGQVYVESEEGQGSRFAVRFPLAGLKGKKRRGG